MAKKVYKQRQQGDSSNPTKEKEIAYEIDFDEMDVLEEEEELPEELDERKPKER